MLNYIGFTITQVRILGLQKHKAGWGSRYPGLGILGTSLGGGQDTQATVSSPPPCIPDTLCERYQDCLENANI